MLSCHPARRQCLRALGRFNRARHSSSLPIPTSTFDFSQLELELKGRIFPDIHDYLSPQPSCLLDLTLEDFLAPGTFPAHRPPATLGQPLPHGHHLVYFATPTTASELLPDGTDTLHSPGEPFTQRLWAGGRVTFPHRKIPLFDGQKATLQERIADVRVTGSGESEKVFVGIDRRIVPLQKGGNEAWKRVLQQSPEPEELELAFVAERRDLCFMRDKTSPFAPLEQPQKRLQPPPDATFTFPLTPTPSLLFRFSALTFNAHAIHIDPEYTRNVYGLPKLLVHGPLCLTLMLECLNRALKGTGTRGELREVTYRNFRPLFVGEELRVCGKMKKPTEEQNSDSGPPDWEVWIETGKGEDSSLAVRGTASVESRRVAER